MLPQSFLERMRQLLGNEFDAFSAAYGRPRNTGLRRNPCKTASPLPRVFCEDAVPWEPDGYYCNPETRPGLHPWHDAGAYYLQEPSAMAPARLLDAQPGERILDLCAAPGGKTTQIAAAMQGQGLLICNEIHPKRAQILSSNIERLGISNALVLNEHPAHLAERFSNYFDRILVDAPCSGEGMFRKEEAAVRDWSEETVAMCAVRQSEILHSAAQMLRPGGRLVYSTCTFSPEENEGVISQFLWHHSDFFIEKLDAPHFSSGRPDWINHPATGLEYTFRLWPHKLRGEGHFVAVLRRTGTDSPAETALHPAEEEPDTLLDFLEEHNLTLPSGTFLRFGDVCFLAPQHLPSLSSLHVLRAGLELGALRKKRFIPSHALALWLKDFPKTVDLSADAPQTAAYLRGETLHGTQRGWALLRVDSLSLGWVRGADGILKNHYPKGLRHIR